MQNNIVQTLWIDPVMGDHQKQCLRSFLETGSSVVCYSYERIKNLPNGITTADANEIIDKRHVFRDLYRSYATFSDWFRIKLLYDKGGWWVDSDVLCLKAFDIDWPYVFATEIERHGEHEATHICNCVIKMPKGSEMGRSLLDRIERKIKQTDPDRIGWTEIGARYMAKEIVERDMFNYVVDPQVFCPFDYSRFQEIFTKSDFEPNEITYGVHLWNKMWEWSHKEPISEMKENSFFERFITK